MKILSFLLTLVISAVALLLTPSLAHAEVAASGLAVAPVMYAGIGILQVIILVSLFIFIPVALIGMVFRLLGFKKSDKSGKWHWNSKQALSHFIKYFLYNTLMVAIWFIILQGVTGETYLYSNYRRFNPPSYYCSTDHYTPAKCERNYGINYNCADYNRTRSGQNCINSLKVINGSFIYDLVGPVISLSSTILLGLTIYIFAWAAIGPYITYFWNKIRNKQVIRPTFWLHARLLMWNIIVFIGVGVFINLYFYFK